MYVILLQHTLSHMLRIWDMDNTRDQLIVPLWGYLFGEIVRNIIVARNVFRIKLSEITSVAEPVVGFIDSSGSLYSHGIV